MTDASDINSVAGVLKLYLRKLREPLFPIVHIEHIMDLARKYLLQVSPKRGSKTSHKFDCLLIFFYLFSELESKHEFVVKMRDLVMSLPRPNIVVLRYLFAFLNQ